MRRQRGKGKKKNTHGKGDVDAVVDDDFGLSAPDVFEQVLHDETRLVPYELVVSLQTTKKKKLS